MQVGRLLIVEIQRADLRHHDERAVRQRLRIPQADEHVSRRAVRVHAHRRLRELRQTNGQVLVGAWKVDVPTAAVTIRCPAEHDPAELEGTVEVVDGGIGERALREGSEPASATAALSRDSRHNEHDQSDRRRGLPSHRRSLRQ